MLYFILNKNNQKEVLKMLFKCVNCSSYKVCLKFNEREYKIINECYNCYNIIHLFIDDFFLNYKEFYTSIPKKENISEMHICSKHNKPFISFCDISKEILCDECRISHDNINHPLQIIEEIIDNKNKNEINEYKNELNILKEIIEKKIEENKNNEYKEGIKLLKSILYIIIIKSKFFNLNFQDDKINAYDLISIKYMLNMHNKAKNKLLTKTIQDGTFPSQNDINEYNKHIFYSFKSVTKDKIINNRSHNWVNHIIQLKNGNIMSSTWDSLSIFKINQENKKLDLIITIHVNNGSINHMYEYKKNKILCCDNQMKIVQLNEENDQYKILYISDYSRKIIPYIPSNINDNNESLNKFLFSATPNGIKLYHYLDEISENNFSELNRVENDILFLGDFSNGCDYSAIIQADNKICGIFSDKNNNINKHFSVWEINYDFNIGNFSKNKFNLLGKIKNIGAGIGRYSLTNINNKYALIGLSSNGYYYYNKPNEKNKGIAVVSLEYIQIIQYINNGDDIMAINCLKNGMILTGGFNNSNARKYFIKQYKYDEKNKEIIFVSSLMLHYEFINTIDDIKDGAFMSCSRDGNIFIVYN